MNDKSLFHKQLEIFILGNNHPCVMAQMVFKQEQVIFGEYGQLGQEEHSARLLSDLDAYLQGYNFNDGQFNTFIATFPTKLGYSEVEFEKALWQQLQLLHQLDDTPWDAAVSSDPESNSFSFSLKGKAFYIVGMHPGSSRKARQSPVPILVFNLHHQFERLRALGSYEETRNTIRKNDKALQGNVNPMLKDFGAGKEAVQYSGRRVSRNWECPFHSKK